ncbi:restriction endonuclease subunit S [Streptomyces decoyicus]|uniref:restriction endonuclease subunit S n=1 Tax=Streptomyces decoyicus TaxID=249567 RepID=UPI00364DD3D4
MTDRSWPIEKLGRTARIGNGSTPRRDSTIYWDSGDVPWLNSSVVNKSRVTQAEQFVTPVALQECHLPVVAPGSVLVGLTGQGKTRGMATILDIEATLNQHIAYVTPDPSRWFPEYLLWSLRSAYDELRCLSEENGSTKGGLTCEALKQFRLVVPPFGYQRVIANYLDRETARIDTLIEEQQRLIELLRERRNAVLSEAFSAGPSTEMTRVGRLLSARPSYGVLVPKYVDEVEGVPFVRVGDILNLDTERPLLAIAPEQSNEYSRTRISGGEVLLGVVGKMGQAAVAPRWLAGANVARAVAVLRCRDAVVAPLLCAWLGSNDFLRQAELATSGDSIQPTLGMKDLARFDINLPTHPRAAADLAAQTAKIDTLIAEAERFIELADERRSALITAAVTGQIDVREAA